MATSSPYLDRVGQESQIRSSRIASVLRVGVVSLLVGAMLLDTRRGDWPGQIALIVFYSVVTVAGLIVAFSPLATLLGRFRPQLIFTVIDVLSLTGFQFLSDGGYLPLLVLVLLPVLMGLEISGRRSATVLTLTIAIVVVSMFADPEIGDELHWPQFIFVMGVFVVLSGAAATYAHMVDRQVRAVAGLTTLREELLSQTMTASDVLQRRVSESIHDGPLQDVLAARQALRELAARAPDEELDHALTSLQAASARLREAIFELHPAVLDEVGVGAAVQQLASSAADRSGIAITTDIEYPVRADVDPIVFGVARELLSNVVRHSQATRASVTLAVGSDTCVLDVADNGVGLTPEKVAHRLGEGHIGLASHRARVEAAGGELKLIDEPLGTHIRMHVPLAGNTLSS